MKRLSHFIAEKNIFHIIRIVQEHFWHNYSFQRVLYPTKLKNYGNFRGWGLWQAPPGMEIREGVGGLKQKCPPWAGMDIFRNYTLNARPLTWSLMTQKIMLTPDLTIKVEQDTKCKNFWGALWMQLLKASKWG